MFTGRWLSGKEAEGWGLVLRAVPADRLDEELKVLLSALRDKSRPGLGRIKRTTLEGQDMPLRGGDRTGDRDLRGVRRYLLPSQGGDTGLQRAETAQILAPVRRLCGKVTL